MWLGDVSSQKVSFCSPWLHLTLHNPLHSCHGDAHIHGCWQNGPSHAGRFTRLRQASDREERRRRRRCRVTLSSPSPLATRFSLEMFLFCCGELIEHSFGLTCCYAACAQCRHAGNSSSSKRRWWDSNEAPWLAREEEKDRMKGEEGEGDREEVWDCFVMRRSACVCGGEWLGSCTAKVICCLATVTEHPTVSFPEIFRERGGKCLSCLFAKPFLSHGPLVLRLCLDFFLSYSAK